MKSSHTFEQKDDLRRSPARSSEAATELSWRTVNLAEVASVLTSILLTEWALAPLAFVGGWVLAGPPLLALAFMIYSHCCRRESWRLLGFTTAGFGRALLLLSAPTLLAVGALLLLGYFTNSFHLSERAWTRFALLPVWALVQQYALLGFLYRRLRAVSTTGVSIIVTAGLFALVHAPNYPLMALTLMGGLISTCVYERASNLFAPAISHVVITIAVLTTIPETMLPSMTVGYTCFLYQRF